MNGDKIVTGIFTQITYTLTVQSPDGSGSTSPSTGSYTYVQGASAQVTAMPATGWLLDHWVLDGVSAGSANSLTLTMNVAHIVRPVFTQLPQHQIYHAAQAVLISGWNGQQTVNVRNSISTFTTLVNKNQYAQSSWLAEWKGDFNWLLAPGDHSILPLLQDGTLKAITVTWNPYADVADTQTLKNIASGIDDAYILTTASECKTFGYPIYMRLGAEMDICQGDSPTDRTWATSAPDFVAAWKHVVDIYRAQGVTNVLWVWNPNCQSSGFYDQDAYYPGDNYVDWVGIDMYQFYDTADPDAQMTHLYNQYASRKPIGIFEWGTNAQDFGQPISTDASRAAYMEKFFNAVESRPDIKLIEYWYIGVFKFDTSTPLTTSMYIQRISSPIYISK
jgi:hypothetical protein